MNSIVPTVHAAILRYSSGELSASEAADLLGGDATVHDVIAGIQRAHLPLPRRPLEAERAALERARSLFRMQGAG